MHINENGIHCLSLHLLRSTYNQRWKILVPCWSKDRGEWWVGKVGRGLSTSALQYIVKWSKLLQIVFYRLLQVLPMLLRWENFIIRLWEYFTLNIKSALSRLFNCTLILSIIVPIWDVISKLFEAAIIITTQIHWPKKLSNIVTWKLSIGTRFIIKHNNNIYCFSQAVFTLSGHDKYNEKKLCWQLLKVRILTVW